MRRRICAVLVAGLVLFSTVLDAATEETHDGRFGTQCAQSAFGNTCMLSFYRLLATPEKYHGKLVLVSGFFIKVGGIEPMLFPNRDSYNSGETLEGIYIIDGSIPPDIAAHLKEGISPVWIIGVFDARFIGYDLRTLGALRNVKNIVLGGFPPSLVPRESK